ncbi:MAG TPA: hypothetical protein VJG90_04030 [Candidatus Nanoarchaeia archaeon]|nr:hypothetical protein [Candidatus Nanoarchaeia archaeon]
MKALQEIWPKFLQLLWIPILAIFEYVRYEYDIMAGFRFLFLLAVILIIYDYLQTKKHFQLFQHIAGHTSATTTLMGISIVLAALDYDLAKASILMMVLGDLFAGVVRRTLVKEKSDYWKSFAACFIGCLIAGFLVLSNPAFVLIMALVASWVEAKIFVLDDNLFMVLLAGLTGQILRFLAM